MDKLIIAATLSIIAMLPDGPRKEQEQDKLVRLEYRKWTLENRKESYGTVPLLEKEMDLQRVKREIDEVAVFTLEVQARKASLETQA